MPTLAVGMHSQQFGMPTASVGMAPETTRVVTLYMTPDHGTLAVCAVCRFQSSAATVASRLTKQIAASTIRLASSRILTYQTRHNHKDKTTMRPHLTTLLLLILTLSVSTLTAAEDWPQFRGPGGQGHSQASGLPVSWSESENIAWKVALEGTGWSSPVVLGKTIWVTTALETPCTPEETNEKRAKLNMPVPSVKFVNTAPTGTQKATVASGTR